MYFYLVIGEFPRRHTSSSLIKDSIDYVRSNLDWLIKYSAIKCFSTGFCDFRPWNTVTQFK